MKTAAAATKVLHVDPTENLNTKMKKKSEQIKAATNGIKGIQTETPQTMFLSSTFPVRKWRHSENKAPLITVVTWKRYLLSNLVCEQNIQVDWINAKTLEIRIEYPKAFANSCIIEEMLVDELGNRLMKNEIPLIVEGFETHKQRNLDEDGKITTSWRIKYDSEQDKEQFFEFSPDHPGVYLEKLCVKNDDGEECPFKELHIVTKQKVEVEEQKFVVKQRIGKTVSESAVLGGVQSHAPTAPNPAGVSFGGSTPNSFVSPNPAGVSFGGSTPNSFAAPNPAGVSFGGSPPNPFANVRLTPSGSNPTANPSSNTTHSFNAANPSNLTHSFNVGSMQSSLQDVEQRMKEQFAASMAAQQQQMQQQMQQQQQQMQQQFQQQMQQQQQQQQQFFQQQMQQQMQQQQMQQQQQRQDQSGAIVPVRRSQQRKQLGSAARIPAPRPQKKRTTMATNANMKDKRYKPQVETVAEEEKTAAMDTGGPRWVNHGTNHTNPNASLVLHGQHQKTPAGVVPQE